jgi:hypothetical protein
LPPITFTKDDLAAALAGFEAEKSRIDARIAELRGMLAGPVDAAASSVAGEPKRKVSAAARRRMAKAQKLRWKKIRQNSGASQPASKAAAAKPKRTMSASARKRIAAAQRLRWRKLKQQPATSKAPAKKAPAKKTATKRRPAAAKAPEPQATA